MRDAGTCTVEILYHHRMKDLSYNYAQKHELQKRYVRLQEMLYAWSLQMCEFFAQISLPHDRVWSVVILQVQGSLFI